MEKKVIPWYEMQSTPKRKRIVNRDLLDEYQEMCCCVCGGGPCTASHIKSRGSGGHDIEDNLCAMCQRCHVEWGWSPIKFIQRYPKFRAILEQKGWEIVGEKLRRK